MNSIFTLLGAALVLASSSLVNGAPTPETIFISAKAPISAEEFSGSVSVVTAAQIKASGARTLAEALEGVPGISIGITGGNAGEEIRIRGMAAEYGLILLDGKRIPNTERNVPFSPANRNRWVAIENIERIEVIRGPASSLYGADALSGVINIITKKATKQWQSSVTVSGRAFKRSGGDGTGINIATGGALSDNVTMKFSVDQQHDNIMLDDTGLSIRSMRRVTNSQLGLSIELDPESQLDLGIIYGEETALDTDAGFSGGTSSSKLKQIKKLFSADYSTKIADFNSMFSISNAVTSVKQGSSDWLVNDNNVGFDIDGAMTERQYLSAGIGYRTEKADRYDKDFSETYKSVTGYVQDVIDVNESHSLTLGFSIEDHNKYGDEVSPKIYWNWSVNPQWTVKAGYSEGRIAPAIREGSSQYVINAGPNRTYQGNDDLRPEESQTLELSASYDEGDYSGSLAVFNSEINDLIAIEEIKTGSHTLALYSNVNRANIRGLESSFAWQMNNNTNLSFNYTYLDTENKSGSNQGKQLTKRPQHTANFRYSQYLTGIESNLSIAFKTVSSQYTDSANSNKISGHGIVDIGMVKSLSEKVELSLNIKNLTDKEVMDGSEAIYVGREFRIALTGRF